MSGTIRANSDWVSSISIGDLVRSKVFEGVGKVLAFDRATQRVKVGFFESPVRPEVNPIWLSAGEVFPARLLQEAIVYCRRGNGIWQRGRYLAAIEGKGHRVIYRQDEAEDLDISGIYCMNLRPGFRLAPDDFLALRSNDAPFFAPLRSEFTKAYVAQRAACRSIAAIPSSSIALEPHQLAVVRRVLQDPIQKYLLADEVGLGKTVEAGILIRQHILERKREARVVVAVPESLVLQWSEELTLRFHLGELLEEDPATVLRICAHEDLTNTLRFVRPTLLAIDEAHQLAPWAWSTVEASRLQFEKVAAAATASESVLLISGTPLHGNEENYHAMLHLLSPDNHVLDEGGVARFRALVEDRERLGGIVSALIPTNSNAALEGVVLDLEPWALKDPVLAAALKNLRPLVEWGQAEQGEDREVAVRELRRYLGEAYALHRRMLRNRREDSALSDLFPGLAGLEVRSWEVNSEESSTDEWLEEYRLAAATGDNQFFGMNEDFYGDWVDDLLANPVLVAERARRLLQTEGAALDQEERRILQNLARSAETDQGAKDRVFLVALEEWLRRYPKGKAVVFCASPQIADQVSNLLAGSIGFQVERHAPGRELGFSDPRSHIRVLVCDRRGEDGLNLHGAQRMAVHYSLTRSISSIEQRLGRLNRYCPSLRGARQVASLAFSPERGGVVRHWLELLDEGIGAFTSTVASLQHFLEARLNEIWKQSFWEGDQTLMGAIRDFQGDGGLIMQERRRVRAQEELNDLDEDVAEAERFATQIAAADREADDHAHHLSRWLTEGLHFARRNDESGAMRFFFDLGSHSGSRTLVDARTFSDSCLTGIDRTAGYPPRTEPMTPLREGAGRGVYPLRFGQPFLDAIWDLMQVDSRGASWAFLRPIRDPGLTSPKWFFRMDWLVAACPPGSTSLEARKFDELFPPVLKTQWVREDGRPLGEKTIAVLSARYDKQRGPIGDLNLRPEIWEAFEEILEPRSWEAAVRSVAATGRKAVLGEFSLANNLRLHASLLSMGAVVACPQELLRPVRAQLGLA